VAYQFLTTTNGPRRLGQGFPRITEQEAEFKSHATPQSRKEKNQTGRNREGTRSAISEAN
jgi:hypothetical protein